MLQAVARKVASMQQTAHDNAMRQEGAAAAFAAAIKRVGELPRKKGATVDRFAQTVAGLLANLQQAAANQMAQQAGRALQANDILETCKALAAPEVPDTQDT